MGTLMQFPQFICLMRFPYVVDIRTYSSQCGDYGFFLCPSLSNLPYTYLLTA